MSSDASCIFCKIVAGDIPCHRVFETEHTLCFLDINPYSHGHALVIPKAHAAQLHDMSEDSMCDVSRTLLRVAKLVGGENYNIVQNNGSLAGQEVMHAHFHIIPRTSEEDGCRLVGKAMPTDHPHLATLASGFRSKLGEQSS